MIYHIYPTEIIKNNFSVELKKNPWQMSLKMSPLFYQHVTILPDILITLESKQLRVELKADGKCSFNLKKA